MTDNGAMSEGGHDTAPIAIPDQPSGGRHARPRSTGSRIASVIGVLVAIALWTLSFLGGWTLQRTVAASDGEPPEVLVATWMRDNGMGPVVAQLEDLYYRYIVPPEVGGDPTVSADVAAEDAAGFEVVSASPSPSATGSTAPSIAPSALPSPSVSPTPSHLMPPPPLISPVAVPEPKEGVWQAVASPVDGVKAVYVTRVRADDVHTKYYASVMWIDTSLTRAMFIPGYEEPAGGPNPFNGALPKEYWPQVLANFNGAFRLEDSMGGYAYDGEVVKPLVKGKGTTVVYRDGSIEVGKWGRDFPGLTDDMMAVRQNLNLIVDRGESKVTSASDNVVWGATTDKENLAWRAAIGEREDGSIVYVGSPYLSAQGLADTLVRAGVQRAMVLDMNNYWTAGFYFRHRKDGTPVCRKLDPQIPEGCDRFLRPYKRDSFQFLANQPLSP